MKKKILILSLCIAIVVLTLTGRKAVYDITSDQTEQTTQQATFPAEQISIYYHQRRPYYMGTEDQVKGLVAEPVNLIFYQTDIPHKWIEIPAGRQLDLIRKNKEPACAAGWFKTVERMAFSKFSNPIYRDKPMVAITRIDNPLIFKSDKLERVLQENRLRLLVKNGYSYGYTIDSRLKKYKPWTITTTADNMGMLKMIQTHRADYCFMTEEEAYDLLLFSGLNRNDFKTVFFDAIPEGNFRYLLCSKKVKDSHIESLNAAISHFLKISDDTE